MAQKRSAAQESVWVDTPSLAHELSWLLMKADSAPIRRAGGAVAVIPARYHSSRFPGKPLADRTGRPLIQHVVERVRLAQRITRVIVATDDTRIQQAVESFGGEVVITKADHPNGTSRIAEVVGQWPKEPGDWASQIIVNVQGDEPEIEPHVIDQLVEVLAAEPVHDGAPMATLASAFNADEDPHDPNIVKVVTARVQDRWRAMYFSRSVIPYDRDGLQTVAPLKHPGLYAYRRSFLLRYVQLSATPLEQVEQLEQLRALEHGHPIAVAKTSVRHHGIDTPQQYEAFVQRWVRPATHS